MKKTQIYGIVLAAAALSFASCTEDFLSVDAPTKLSEESFYASEQDLKEALVAAYTPMQWDAYWEGWGSTVQLSEIMSDDVRSGNIPSDQAHLHPYDDFTVRTTGDSQRWWNMSYRGVYRSNQVIEKLQNAIDAGMDTETAARYRAEAIFLRAYHYFQVWRLYGNIPYYETNLTYPYAAPQLTPDEVYQNVVWGENGLDSIIDALPDLASDKAGGANSLPANELGRATKAAAQMLKARWVMYQNDETKFADVLADMKEIINSGKFALKTTREKDYRVAQDARTPAMSYQPNAFEALFMDEGEWSSESIFEVNFTDNGSANNWSNGGRAGGTVGIYMQSPRGLGTNNDFVSGGYGFSTVMKSAFDMYDDADIRKNGGIIDMWAWYDNYKIVYPAVAGSNPFAPGFPATEDGDECYSHRLVNRPKDTGFYLKKVIARMGYNQKEAGSGTDVMAFRNNTRIFRYAETLLNAAELAVRTGDASAQTYLDAIRNRAYEGEAPALTATLDNIMQERRKEFIGEGLRYWDLVRTGKANEVLGPLGWYTNISWGGVNRWVAPIPESEVSRSASTEFPLEQNEGY